MSALDYIINDYFAIDEPDSGSPWHSARAELAQLRARVDMLDVMEGDDGLIAANRLMAACERGDILQQLLPDIQEARNEIVALRARITSQEDDKYCPLCTWRGPVELVNGICPQCGVDWPKAYREYRDALTIAKERIAEQARQAKELRTLAEELVNALGYWLSVDQEPQEVYKAELALGAWLAANPTPTEDSHQ